jgi:hypothetical protein
MITAVCHWGKKALAVLEDYVIENRVRCYMHLFVASLVQL